MTDENDGIVVAVIILILIAFGLGAGIGINMAISEDNPTNNTTETVHVENVTTEMIKGEVNNNFSDSFSSYNNSQY